MAFHGYISSVQLHDLLQLAAGARKTGMFIFESTEAASPAKIFFFQGQMVHAELDCLDGEEAIYRLAAWEDGEFRFVPGAITGSKTIIRDSTAILMEAARRLDELRLQRK